MNTNYNTLTPSSISLQAIFQKLKFFTDDTEHAGITRLAYSSHDEAAHEYIKEILTSKGLQVRQDAMGNIFARLEGNDPSLAAIGSGSHLDTVPQGGAYDGVVGVIAGLDAITRFSPGELRHSIELVIFRAEESSRFGFACMGSKVMAGLADTLKWKKNTDAQGLNFFQVLEKQGYDSHDLAQCRLPDHYFTSFIEVHIEQGKVLEQQKKNLGIVYGIAAPSRYRVDIHGHADHSGATPMAQRHDALVTAALIIGDIYHAACSESSFGTVGTVGKLDVFPNAMNVIPGGVSFYVDIRGVDCDSIERVIRKFKASVEKATIDQDVAVSIHELAHDQPVLLDEELCQTMEKLCAKHHIPAMRIMSGAGHDAMYMASRFPTAMLFVPSQSGVSHHPEEFTSWEYIEQAADLLAETIRELDCRCD